MLSARTMCNGSFYLYIMESNKMGKVAVTRVCLKDDYYLNAPDSVSNCEDAYLFIRNQIGFGTVERVMILCMDYDYHLIKCAIVSIGNDDKAVLDIGEIFKIALLLDAHHILISHNHLGSSLIPTESDIQITQKIGYVGKVLGISLIDSIIVNAGENYQSIRKFIMEREKKNGMDEHL